MAKPNYASLLAQIASTPAGSARDALIAECYQFLEPLTAEEENLFNYVSTDYLEDTPGTTSSYIGIYYGEDGIIQ